MRSSARFLLWSAPAALFFVSPVRAQRYETPLPVAPLTANGCATVEPRPDLMRFIVREFFGRGVAGPSSAQYVHDPSAGTITPFTTAHVPNGLVDAAAAYDPYRSRVVYFGGHAGGPALGETWELARINVGGTLDWLQRSPTLAPPARTGAAMVYVSALGSVILFGGQNGTTQFRDLWSYDGYDWQPLPSASAMPARHDHAMVWDELAFKIRVFGGRNATTRFADTWEFSTLTNQWAQRATSSAPPARARHAMGFDKDGGKTYVFGGEGNAGLLNDTWVLNGDWSQLSPVPNTPSPRADMNVLWGDYSMYCYGGEGTGGQLLGEAVLFDPQTASNRSFGSGCGPTISAVNRPVLGTNYSIVVQQIPLGITAFMMLGLSRDSLGSLPLPLDLGAFGAPGCWLLQDALFGAFLVVNPGPPGTGAFSMLFPVNPTLAGFELHAQAWHPSGASIRSSEGLRIRLNLN